MVSLTEVLKGYRVLELSHVLEEGMPRPPVPYGHIPGKSHSRGDAFNTFMVLVFEHARTHVGAPIHLGGVDGPGLDVSLRRRGWESWWCWGSS